jgi:hypothetical protein
VSIAADVDLGVVGPGTSTSPGGEGSILFRMLIITGFGFNVRYSVIGV